MSFLKKVLCFVLCCLLLLPMSARAEEQDRTQAICRDLIAYYFHYRDKASAEIGNQLQTLASLDPRAAALWQRLMDSWAWINEEMPVHTGVLPEGLPQDDSLCIVVLGFGLEANGDMKPELVDRLEVALASAEKYPESYVLCTGGETAQVPNISEAGQMGAWLLSRGLAHNRLILEEDSLSTTENARNSLQLLWREYPQVKSMALVTSDYHIPWGMACFSAMNILRGGEQELNLVGNGACQTATPRRDTMYSQAWGISILADIPFDSSYVPILYMTGQEAQPVTEPAQPVPAEAAAEEAPEEPVVPILLGLAVVLAVLFLPKKRRKSGSD